MTRGLATAMTLLLASVSGLAIWRTDGAALRAPARALAAPAAAAAPAPDAPTADAEPATAPRTLRGLLERWLDRELVVELRREPRAVTLRVAWRRAADAALVSR